MQLRSGDAFDLILTDVVMPGIGGIEFARQTRTTQPNVPIVLVTGRDSAMDSGRTVVTSTVWNPDEYKRVLGNLPAAAYVCDRNGLITYFNRRASAIWGREPVCNDLKDRYCGSHKMYSQDGSPVPTTNPG